MTGGVFLSDWVRRSSGDLVGSDSTLVVIIGGVAGGATAAARSELIKTVPWYPGCAKSHLAPSQSDDSPSLPRLRS